MSRMELEITENNNNPLLNRQEVQIVIKHESDATPKRNQVIKSLSEKLKAKKDLIIKARGYNSGLNSEDYDLWLRLKSLNISWDNMNEILLDYRIHNKASQRALIGYAESAGYAMREFILRKSLTNFIAIFYHLLKSFIRSNKKY